MIEPMQSDAAFLADVARAPGESPDRLHLWWLGQSGYLLRHRQTTILIDPYLSDSLTIKYMGTPKPHVRISGRVVNPGELGRALATWPIITSSHAHTDHLDAETLRPFLDACGIASLVTAKANVQLSMERSAATSRQVPPRFIALDDGDCYSSRALGISAIASAHDQIDRDEQRRCKYLGYVFDLRISDGQVTGDHVDRTPGPSAYRIYHSGDTVAYEGLAERVRELGPIDLAILPINGKVGNMGGNDAARLAKEIGAKRVIPCHYDMFEFNTADPKDEFIPACERIRQPYRVLQLGERLSL